MPASRDDIRRWLDAARAENATHLIVKCDTFDYTGGRSDGCCYPIPVRHGEDVREKAVANGDRLMEIYSLTGTHSVEEQLATSGRVFNYD
jgi:hypothetical protein